MGRPFGLLLLAFILLINEQVSYAACGGTVRQWLNPANNRWNNANNWSGVDIPDTASEDVEVISAEKPLRANQNATIGCFNNISGRLRCTGRTITVTGDYWRNTITAGSESCDSTAGLTFTVEMGGSTAQTLENVDELPNVNIANDSSVTVTNAFTIWSALTFDAAWTGTLNINADLTLSSVTNSLTIPTGGTVVVQNGATLTVNNGITVNGTLKVKSGSTVLLANGNTLTVASGATLEITGAESNVATIKVNGTSNTFNLNINGSLNASYFRIDRLSASGVNVSSTGTVTALNNGEFHYLAANGVALTLASGATVTEDTMDEVGFFDDDAHGNVSNIDATNFSRGSAVTLDQWSGDVGDEANELSDPNCTGGCFTWLDEAGTRLTLSDNTASGNPTNPVGLNATNIIFGTWAFALNKADTEANITAITFTMTGDATASDITNIRLYQDDGATNCQWDGSDTQLGTGSLSGSPLQVAFSAIALGDIATSSTTASCVHLVADIGSNAADQSTMQFEIQSTNDVANEKTGLPAESYLFASASSPPVAAPSTLVSPGVPSSLWDGSRNGDNNWTSVGNWTPKTLPSSTRTAKIGVGSPQAFPGLDGAGPWEVLNFTGLSGGGVDFLSSANTIGVYGSFSIESNFDFNKNANVGILAFKGSDNQSIIQFDTAHPGVVHIDKTTSTAEVVLSDDATLNSDLYVKEGVLIIPNGYTLLVYGNIIVETGGTLEIQAGGTLKLAHNKTLTVDSGGKLKMVGSSGTNSVMTSELATTAYEVVINGTIEARYYQFSNLGTNGVSINSGATIDATNHLQDGTWTYPVNSSSTMLSLAVTVPTNTMNNQVFDSNGSSATSVVNIDTTGIGSASGTLNVDTFSGDLGGSAYDNPGTGCTGTPCYDLLWTGAVNTIDVTQDAAGPGSADAGTTVNMGRFGLQQANLGADYFDSDLQSFKITLLGTGTSGDVTAVRLYYDSDCNSTGGVQVGGSQTFAGNPPQANFSFTTDANNTQKESCSSSTADICIEASAAGPLVQECLYVEYDLAIGAVGGHTIGVELENTGDIVMDNGYELSAGTPAPVNLGSVATIIGSEVNTWNGAVSTDWFNANNWSETEVPTSTQNCDIVSASNMPTIGNGTAVCSRIRILSGTLTMTNGVGANLEIYGDFEKTGGTFTQNDGVLKMRDAGTPNTQTISSNSTISSLTFNKTAGGNVDVSGTLTINDLDIPSGSNFDFRIPDSQVLILPNGLTLNNGVFNIQGGGEVRIPSGQSVTVAGGTFKTTGTNDANEQTESSKGQITNNGSGTWSFNATSGTVDLTGFHIANLDTTGFKIQGSTTIANLNGGQFTNIPTDYATPVRGLYLNTTGSVPTTMTNVGFFWADFNDDSVVVPGVTDNYYVVYADNCSSNTISLDQWFGSFFLAVGQPNTEDKIYDSDDGAATCQINMASSASPVSLRSKTATPYNGSVSLDWETVTELDHAGFNVYRSTSPATGFIQVNNRLIRNSSTASTYRGIYRYLDTDVNNGTTYYYYLEDVSYQGATEMHGPLSAMPEAHLAAAPGDDPDSNNGGSDPGAGTGNDPTPGPIDTPDAVDLGNGVHVLAQTNDAVRIEVIPPDAVFAASSWNGTYETVAVPGYSSMILAGYPELLFRNVLIEVESTRTNAAVIQEVVTEAAPSNHTIAPAPAWVDNGSGGLMPTWSTDAAAYANGDYSPAKFYEVDPVLKSVAGKKYISLKVYPFLYKALTGDTKELDKLVIDVGLDGYDWQDAPTDLAYASPASVAGTVRIRYAQTGMYRMSYDDLVASAVDGPLDGVDPAALRLYRNGVEIPMEVISADSVFDSGDEIRFFAEYFRVVEDSENELVLAPFPVFGESDAPLRIATLDGDPAGLLPDVHDWTYASTLSEQDHMALFDRPVAEGIDRFYWQTLYVESGAAVYPGDGWAKLDMPVETPGLIKDSGYHALVQLHVTGRGMLSVNPEFHVGLHVNGVTMLSEAQFQATEPTIVSFMIPQSYFVSGANTITVQQLGDTIPAGDWGYLDIDRATVHYRSHRWALDDHKEVFAFRKNRAVDIEGFSTANIEVYDVSDEGELSKMSNSVIAGPNGDGEYSVTYASNAGAGENGYRYLAYESTALLMPSSVMLSQGSDLILKQSDNGADLIAIGTPEMLSSAHELLGTRADEGLRVMRVSLEQIYAEFSHGLTSSKAIRDFVNFALDNWQNPKPKYLLFIGDGTYDPRMKLDLGAQPHAMPMYMEHGSYLDFGGDNWFATNDDGKMPRLAVGRIPAANPAEVYNFVDKLLAYESGGMAPSKESSDKLTFVSGDSPMGEGFAAYNQQLAEVAKGAHKEFEWDHIDRSEIGDDAVTKQGIIDAFDSGPLLINYLGHGAEDQWADAAMFDNDVAAALSNDRLPVVMALNCLNSMFYDADPEYRSLGEKLLFNPQGGAMAFIGSTTMTTPTAQINFGKEFMEIIGREKIKPQNQVRLGDMFLEAKSAFGDLSSHADTLRSFVLFGDPSARFPEYMFPPALKPIIHEPDPETKPQPKADPASVLPTPEETPAVAAPSRSDDGDHRPFHKKVFGCAVLGDGAGSSAAILIILIPVLIAMAPRPRRVRVRRRRSGKSQR